jgi:hypothetical protein
MPITGPWASSRAASSPGSPKQAITCPSTLLASGPDLLQHADRRDGFVKVALN